MARTPSSSDSSFDSSSVGSDKGDAHDDVWYLLLFLNRACPPQPFGSLLETLLSVAPQKGCAYLTPNPGNVA